MKSFLANQPSGSASQDRVMAFPAAGATFVLLADGAGGLSGGAEAAQLFVGRLAEAALRCSHPHESLSAFDQIDLAIAAQPICGETTGILAVVTPTTIRGESVGDSEAWLISRDEVQKLTAGQRRKPLLGSGEAVPIDFEYPRREGVLLIASDGLFRYTTEDLIAKVVREETVDESTLERLLSLVRLRSGTYQDDVAIALIDLTGPQETL